VPILLLAVAVGGALGTMARYGLGGYVHGRLGPTFPWGTLTVNVCGSFVLGLLLPLLDRHAPAGPLHAFLVVGCVGAFTTFSTFAWEAVMLLQDGARRRAAAYIGASVALGLAALVAGLAVARLLL
jgi:fluoride exporter